VVFLGATNISRKSRSLLETSLTWEKLNTEIDGSSSVTSTSITQESREPILLEGKHDVLEHFVRLRQFYSFGESSIAPFGMSTFHSTPTKAVDGVSPKSPFPAIG